MPPAVMRAMYSSLGVAVTVPRGAASTGSSRSAASRFSRVPSISPWVRGHIVSRCRRPVSDWAAVGSASWRVDPVITKRPDRSSRFSSALMASRMAGTCWYSSIHTGDGPTTNAPGSASAAARVAGSSRSTTSTPRAPASSASKVDLPTVRGPCRAITGSSVSRSLATSKSRRATIPEIGKVGPLTSQP